MHTHSLIIAAQVDFFPLVNFVVGLDHVSNETIYGMLLLTYKLTLKCKSDHLTIITGHMELSAIVTHHRRGKDHSELYSTPRRKVELRRGDGEVINFKNRGVLHGQKVGASKSQLSE